MTVTRRGVAASATFGGIAAVVALLLLSLGLPEGPGGCGGTERENPGELAVAGHALTDKNGLDYNGLGQNGLSQNGLGQNGLSQNGLSQNGLSQNGLFANWFNSTDYALQPQVMKYLVKCALPAGQSITYTATSGPNAGTYTWDGELGLAPDWVTGPLDTAGQEWVSACLMAHVNALGVTATVSFRGPIRQLSTSAAERASYTLPEAGWYGNLFLPVPVKSVCAFLLENQYSRQAWSASEQSGRSCTAANGYCGLTNVGTCNSVSSPICVQGNGKDGYLSSCTPNGGSSRVFTTYVMDTCGNGYCGPSESPYTCSPDCSSSSY